MKKFRMASRFAAILLVHLAVTLSSPGQNSFSAQVRKFIVMQEDTLALTHVQVIDGTGGPVRQDQTVLIIQGRIAGLGKSSDLKMPARTTVRDCRGKTLIPGMVMMHEHMFYGEPNAPVYIAQEMPLSFPRLYLAGGVTFMRTGGSIEPQTDINIRDWIRAGIWAGPDMDVTGPYIERSGLPIPEMLFINSPEEAARAVNYWSDAGCTSFKLYMDITRADMKAAIEAAHKRGIKITGHLCSVTFREAADLGIDNLEHGFLVSSDFEKGKTEDKCNAAAQRNSIRKLDLHSPDMKDLIEHLVHKKVAITSTLPVFLPYTHREIFPGDAGDALVPEIREKVEALYNSAQGKDSTSIALFKKEMAWEKEFADEGGLLLAGIDPTGAGRVIPGYADRVIPELFTEAGFSLPQAIKICSLNAARYLGRDREIGSIETGKQADLVLIDGDPVKDIHAMRKTEIVFKKGVGFDSRKLFESARGMVGLH